MKTKFLLFLLLVNAEYVFGQVLYPDDALSDYYDIVELKNVAMIKRLNIHPTMITQYKVDSLGWNPWSDQLTQITSENRYFHLLPFKTSVFFNSDYSRSYRDGPLWKGKGLTVSLQGGFTGKHGIVKYTFAPLIYYSQNSPYSLAPTMGQNDPYNYQFVNQKIDFVQRFGAHPFTKFNLGQSEIRMVLDWFTFGISTQNMVWGPSQFAPILMGNNAAGIPRVELGTHHPVSTPLGDVELSFYWGVLSESNYFDNNSKNNQRYWSGAAFGFRPSFLPDLCIGLNRVLYKKGEEFDATDLSIILWRFNPPNNSNPQTGNDEYDQMGSITIEWAFTEVGFQTYFEFAKNDFGGSLVGLEPEHGRGYTMGAVKLVELNRDKLLKLSYEHSTLDRSKSNTYRGYNRWYSHTYVQQGYTQNGQLIAGGGIGPGSNTDAFSVSFIWNLGMMSITGQRIRFDDDYFMESILDNNRHDQEWSGIVKYTRIFNQYRLTTELGFSGRRNMYYVQNNDHYNWMTGVSLVRKFH
ncbi:Capsule assembly protein Wzi [Reichenbachiella faecimaris]|uniref:Capsule assembly protein Wzi n=1 Tax=Reichenbachiella faecimaris TaxID=692418 RepID=A0A1W2GBN2_REIFA|nr:capsule assembly Wzi family protein [Reichenbachiella faecimaris]SMD34080.1 Capsule assembly protein Wzi [Reichenbachiella faecimaris]